MAVFKVSKETYDVLTTGNENLSFSSELATHSVFNTLTVNKSAGVNDAPAISHNMGSGIPKAWVFVDNGTYLSRIPRIESGAEMDYYIDSDVIQITTSNTTAYTFRVMIFTKSIIPTE